MKTELDPKYHRLDPRQLYQAFMTGVVETERRETVSTLAQNLSTFEFFRTKVASEEEEATETIRCIWPFFRLSRLTGMCPITRHGAHLVVRKYYHGSWWITWFALVIQLVMVGNAVAQAQKAILQSTTQLVKRLNSVIYYGHTLANGCYMTWKIREIPQFLVSCKRIENLCRKHRDHQTPRDDGLVRHCFILLMFFTVSQTAGNVLYIASTVSKANASSVEDYFLKANSDFLGDWGGYVSGIFYIFGDVYCDMGWGFADILLALLSVVFGTFFQRLNNILKNKRIGARESGLSLKKIEELRCDHREICHLVQLCNNIFSPLFLLTYVANIGYLFTRLYTGISDDQKSSSLMVRFESMYAFGYQILIKILTPSYLAARMHEQAHEGLKLIHNWPSAVDEPDSKCRLLVIGRFVSQLVTTQTGISGCGYFIISKSFMVTLISALVTYEVIILQFQGAAIATE